jgi:citronellol/citronellal dehydrogenase
VIADLTDEAQRQGIVDEAADFLGGPIEVLVNNAAATIYMPIADFPLKRRRIIFEANVQAPLDLAQAVIPQMMNAGEGWIVNLTSGGAHLKEGPPFDTTPPGSAVGVYGTSKAALNRITNSLGPSCTAPASA